MPANSPHPYCPLTDTHTTHDHNQHMTNTGLNGNTNTSNNGFNTSNTRRDRLSTNVNYNNSSEMDGISGENTDTLMDRSSNVVHSSHKNYEEVALIGSGAYGTVFKARDLNNDGQLVALKKVKVPLNEDGVPISLLREISVLKQLQSFEHPNVVRLLDICHGKRLEHERQLILFLVFEHVEQDLATYLHNCPAPGIGPDRIKELLYQLLTGVDFLHSNRIVHRDLKPANILVTNDGQLKLADFGLARIYQQTQPLTAVVVTLWYRAPEVLLQSSYASPVDIWSVGCIFAELFTRIPLFCGQSENDQLCKIFNVIGSPLPNEWPKDLALPWSTFSNFKKLDFDDIVKDICPDGKNLLEKMLKFDPNKRIGARQALSHQYFKEYEIYPPKYDNNSNKKFNSGNSDDKSSIISR
ncbi:cyclin-dependent kinase 6-like [Oppia nitens]|uniref:cyclin-dependent kinase 6-like n=1 Tax=Oppia nitens TaxID=1686743 RepID=UPI0023DB6B94|nr:cyclin-dependent kinase 6-like [Oppia nitens]